MSENNTQSLTPDILERVLSEKHSQYTFQRQLFGSSTWLNILNGSRAFTVQFVHGGIGVSSVETNEVDFASHDEFFPAGSEDAAIDYLESML